MLQEESEKVTGYPLLPADATGAMNSGFQRAKNFLLIII